MNPERLAPRVRRKNTLYIWKLDMRGPRGKLIPRLHFFSPENQFSAVVRKQDTLHPDGFKYELKEFGFGEKVSYIHYLSWIILITFTDEYNAECNKDASCDSTI